MDTVKKEKDFKLPQRNILWENRIIETIDYAGILVFVKRELLVKRLLKIYFSCDWKH